MSSPSPTMGISAVRRRPATSSQPTLSGQILELEAKLGLRLFEREGRRARVSDRAQGVVAQARATLAAAAGRDRGGPGGARSIRRGLEARHDRDGRALCLADRAQGRDRRAAMTPLHLVEDLTDRLLAKLNEGALDGAVVATDPGRRQVDGDHALRRPFFSSSAAAPGGDAAPRSASTRSIRARSCCSPKAIACATRRSTSAAGPEGRARRGRAGDQPRDAAPFGLGRAGRDAGAAARLRGLAGAWAPDSTGRKVIGGGASRSSAGWSFGAARRGRAALRGARAASLRRGRRKRR